MSAADDDLEFAEHVLADAYGGAREVSYAVDSPQVQHLKDAELAFQRAVAAYVAEHQRAEGSE